MNSSCAIDCKSLGRAAVAAFFVFNVLEYAVHGVLLMGLYQSPRYAALWNPMPVMNGRRLLGLLAYMVIIPAFARLYAQGYEAGKSGLLQGARFGALAGAFLMVYHSLLNYMVYPVGLDLAAAWIALGVAEFVVTGMVVGALYRPAPAGDTRG